MQSLRFQVPRAARAFSTTTARPLSRMHMIGRLGHQPEVYNTSTGREIVKYSLGVVSGGQKDDEGNRPVSWFKVASFQDGPQKEFLLSLPKGSQVYVEADARMESYEVDGNKRTTLNLVQRNMELLQRPRPVDVEVPV